MSPVNRAGSVSEIFGSPLFPLQKFRCVHRRRRASPVAEISVFATEISVTELKIFPYEHSSLVTGMKLESSPEISARSKPGLNFLYEQKTKFVQLTGPARLPASYEEALWRGHFNEFTELLRRFSDPYRVTGLRQYTTVLLLNSLVLTSRRFLGNPKYLTLYSLYSVKKCVLMNLSFCPESLEWCTNIAISNLDYVVILLNSVSASGEPLTAFVLFVCLFVCSFLCEKILISWSRMFKDAENNVLLFFLFLFLLCRLFIFFFSVCVRKYLRILEQSVQRCWKCFVCFVVLDETKSFSLNRHLACYVNCRFMLNS